jgi:hypothetical protein
MDVYVHDYILVMVLMYLDCICLRKCFFNDTPTMPLELLLSKTKVAIVHYVGRVHEEGYGSWIPQIDKVRSV